MCCEFLRRGKASKMQFFLEKIMMILSFSTWFWHTSCSVPDNNFFNSNKVLTQFALNNCFNFKIITFSSVPIESSHASYWSHNNDSFNFKRVLAQFSSDYNNKQKEDNSVNCVTAWTLTLSFLSLEFFSF